MYYVQNILQYGSLFVNWQDLFERPLIKVHTSVCKLSLISMFIDIHLLFQTLNNICYVNNVVVF